MEARLKKLIEAVNTLFDAQVKHFGYQYHTSLYELAVSGEDELAAAMTNLFDVCDAIENSENITENTEIVNKSPKIVCAVVPSDYADKYEWEDGECLLSLGEISNIPGHIAVVDKNGKVYWALHADSFREALDDDL